MVDKKSMNRIALSILVSIILTVILVSLVNVGLSIFLERPDYNDYCGEYKPSPIIDKENPIFCTEDAKLCEDGTSVSRDPLRNCEFPPCSEDYETCQEEWDNANNDFNQKKYYVFALIGFALLLVGLFSKEILVQITGLATGGILVAEGIVTNFQNKVVTFISLFLILVVFGILAYRIVNRD